MCGIAGVAMADGSAPDGALVGRMIKAIAHRGPDGEGAYTSGNVGIGHNRLAIIDLETGDQPIRGPRGIVLVANAEIYNYIELRRQLGESRFNTRSDCEPPVHLYAGAGTGFGQALRGMYAIAIADEAAGRVVLSRDPFGIKPLYYAAIEGGTAFASEPAALVAAGLVPARLDAAARDEMLQLQYSTGRRTIFEGVDRVLPGETLTIEAGSIVSRLNKAALPGGAPADWDEEEAIRRFDAAFMNSVEVHQRADVPYGMFLSGGIDSSAVLAAMRDLNDRPVQAFTAGFSGTRAADEREHAGDVARAAGADFHAVDVDAADFWQDLPAIAAAVDDPAADYAIIPTYKLGRLVHDRGLKVVLSGEGGDELFAGYGRYRRLLRPWFLGGGAVRHKGAFEGLGVLRDDGNGWRAGLDRAAAREATAGRTRLQAAQAMDCADWLPNDLLIKLDRCLMAHGVEGRTPFLDRRVADVAMRLPDNLKVRGRAGKYVLRRWLERKLPEARPFARKKGFTVPVGEWIAARSGEISQLVARQPCIEEACHPSAVEALFRTLDPGRPRAAQAAWRLLFYALWYRRHMEGRAPDGDVFEVLSAN